ncbi:hypothetical protein CANCADRAFT_68269 [Tortispora caseinolytica NRRL Y-17796]|uniref:DNA/RNA-binding domain-containing protein n=1 Tax=Tortispora caseinolytica NRRL Y-17796 TaxID=767744 RepID=A0A1E4TEL8_9ASCO|nr:hypothetical protein CANCADRAFT_68269 [Tortispora caseinolytica NRRL Y-17796]
MLPDSLISQQKLFKSLLETLAPFDPALLAVVDGIKYTVADTVAEDPDAAWSDGVLAFLWADIYSPLIKAYKPILNALLTKQKHEKLSKRDRQVSAPFSALCNSIVKHYKTILSSLVHYDERVRLVASEIGAVASDTTESVNAPESLENLVYHILICIGDSYRYQLQYANVLEEKHTAGVVLSVYRLAKRYCPHKGHAFNQMALVYASIDSPLSAAYCFSRAASCADPFSSSKVNLLRTLGSKSTTWAGNTNKLDERHAAPFIEHYFAILWTLAKVSQSSADNSNSDKISNDVSNTLRAFKQRLSNKKFTTSVVQKIVVLAALHAYLYPSKYTVQLLYGMASTCFEILYSSFAQSKNSNELPFILHSLKETDVPNMPSSESMHIFNDTWLRLLGPTVILYSFIADFSKSSDENLLKTVKYRYQDSKKTTMKLLLAELFPGLEANEETLSIVKSSEYFPDVELPERALMLDLPYPRFTFDPLIVRRPPKSTPPKAHLLQVALVQVNELLCLYLNEENSRESAVSVDFKDNHTQPIDEVADLDDEPEDNEWEEILFRGRGST